VFYLEFVGSSVSALGSKPARWDKALLDFSRRAHRSKQLRTQVVHTVLAVQKRRKFKRWDLSDTWEFLWAWKGQIGSTPRLPLPRAPWKAVVTLAYVVSLQMEGAASKRYWGAGLTLWIGFLGLFRPREMAQLTKDVILLASELGESLERWVTIVIKDPKTKRSFGWTQHVLIQDARLMAARAAFFKGTRATEPLFNGSQDLLGKILQELLSMLGLTNGFTLSSIRAGGATAVFAQGTDVNRLAFHGRWKSMLTLHRYVQEAMAAMTGARLTPAAAEAVSFAANYFDML
jgi:hypothetical protein